MDEFTLKALSEKELSLILQWRNSKRVRAFMYDDHLITWKEHLEWFQHLMNNPQKKGNDLLSWQSAIRTCSVFLTLIRHMLDVTGVFILE